MLVARFLVPDAQVVDQWEANPNYRLRRHKCLLSVADPSQTAMKEKRTDLMMAVQQVISSSSGSS